MLGFPAYLSDLSWDHLYSECLRLRLICQMVFIIYSFFCRYGHKCSEYQGLRHSHKCSEYQRLRHSHKCSEYQRLRHSLKLGCNIFCKKYFDCYKEYLI